MEDELLDISLCHLFQDFHVLHRVGDERKDFLRVQVAAFVDVVGIEHSLHCLPEVIVCLLVHSIRSFY